jgi:glucose-1-phosphate thymidylyltransferase
MKGIVLAGGSGTRLHPLTLGLSKQLLPIYDKPMVYYPISVLMHAGIREILIISTPRDISGFESLLGSGAQFGVSFSYAIQEKPEGIAQAFKIAKDFIGNEEVCLILGDNIFYGAGFESILRRSVDSVKRGNSVILGSYVKNPQRYGVAVFDDGGKLIAVEEKPALPKSNYAVVGLYFYTNQVIDIAEQIKPSKRGEFEISDVNQAFLDEGKMQMETLARGFAWLDTGTHESLMEATEFVKALENRTGQKIACLEEIGVQQGWISLEKVLKNIKEFKGPYYDYIRSIFKA